MYRARPNGSPQEVVQHLTTRCGVPIEVAERLVPNQEGIGDSPRTALTPDALERYQQVVREDYAEEPVLQAVLLLLPLTGLRVSEICHLTKKNLHRDGDKVSWTFHGKGDKERTVPLWRKARRVFEPYMEAQRPRSYLFPNKTRKGAISPATVQEACRHIAGRDESLRHLTPHVLRHTFATMALLNCHDIKRTQEILGHGKKSSIKIPVVMLRYLHPDVQENRGDLQHSKLRGAVAAKRNPEQTVLGGGSLVPAEIYEKLKSGAVDMIPVPNRRNRVYVYSRRRDDVIEVSEDRARTWLALRDASREVAGQLREATRRRASKRPAEQIVPAPEPEPMLVPLLSEPAAKPKRASKAKKNPLETPMNDDWYWKAIYSNVPPGPSRSHPVAQRNPAQEVHIAKNGTPYVYENGRPKFISKAAAARMNPAGAHGAFDQEIDPFGVMERKFDGEQPYARRNKSKKAKAKKNNHRVWEQIIDPFSVTEARTYGRQPIARRNPSEDKQRLLSKSTVPWSKFSKDEIQMILQDALMHGDLVLAEKAKSALNRRSSKSRRNPAGAHGAFDQVIGPFSVEEISFDGEQPYARRNARKSKAKRNGVVRVYEVK